MSFFNIFKNQLAKVIQWENQNPNWLWHQYPSSLNEIKNSSKLIVAPGQGCVLVYEGKIADVIEQEGIYNLQTDNHPFITTLQNLWQNFESEHKLFLYFFRKAEILNQSWGTATPIKYVDAVYNIPVEMGANGNFSYHINNIQFFYVNIVGSKSIFTTEDMQNILLGRIPQSIAQIIAEKKYSYQEIDAQLPQIADAVKNVLNLEYDLLGLQLSDFRITGTLFDSATKTRIAKVADINIDILSAKNAGLDYVELEKLRALRDAARNEGGLAGAGLQMGVGMELGKILNSGKEGILSNEDEDVMQKLKKLKLLLDENIISPEDFESKKKEILSKI